MQEKFNLIDVLKHNDINIELAVLKYLLMYKHKSTGLIGKGETLLRIIMCGTNSEKNDFKVGTAKYEVKFGVARLRGMSGFDRTDATLIMEELDRGFLEVGLLNNIRVDDLISAETNRWTFISGKSKKRTFLLESICNRLYPNVAPLTYASIYVKAFAKHFIEMTDQEKKDLTFELSKEFVEGNIPRRKGYSDFVYKLAAFSLKYYQRVEGFDNMMFLNNDLECMYLPASYIKLSDLTSLAQFIRDDFNRLVPPNLSGKAGIQGSSFGIIL